MLSNLPAALVAILFFGPASESWPEFRGPTGQGIAPEGPLPGEWSPTKNVAWKHPIPGSGWSSPVVDAGRIYLTTSVPVEKSASKDLSLRALCLDAHTGSTIWDTEVFLESGQKAPRVHQKNTHASPTPLLHAGKLYVHFGHQGTACLDLDGSVLWRNISVNYQPVHGNGGSPVFVDGMLVFSCDGGDSACVVALDAATGELRWKTPRTSKAQRKFSFSTPLVISVNGKSQIISAGSDMVGAYEPQSGREIWRVRYIGYSVIPRPVYAQGLVFVTSGFSTPSLIAIRPDGQGDVTRTHIAWRTSRAAPLTPSPLVVGDELYTVADNGVASCLEATTGKVLWQERIGGNYSASPLYGDGKVYFQSEQGPAVVVKAGKQFERVAKNTLDERALASYAAADGALFIRTEKHLYRIQ
jgi:outer membrane protein assembly factor BamB